MTKFVGRLGTLGIGIEATRGTPVAPTLWVPWTNMSFFDRQEIARESQSMGRIEDSDSIYVTLKMGEGEIENQLYDKALGAILASLLGAVPVTTGAGPYTHTFTLSNSNQQKTLSLYWKDPIYSIMFPMAVVDSLEIKVETRGIVEYTIGFKSRESRDWTSQTPDFTSLGSKFLHQHLEQRFATTIAGLTGATAISAKSVRLNISRNTKFDDVLGTVSPEDILAQHLSVEGKLGLNLEDDTWRQYALTGAYRAYEFKLNAGSTSSLQLRFPRVDFSEWEPDYDQNKIAQQEINLKGNYDSANGLAIISTAVLINQKNSY